MYHRREIVGTVPHNQHVWHSSDWWTSRQGGKIPEAGCYRLAPEYKPDLYFSKEYYTYTCKETNRIVDTSPASFQVANYLDNPKYDVEKKIWSIQPPDNGGWMVSIDTIMAPLISTCMVYDVGGLKKNWFESTSVYGGQIWHFDCIQLFDHHGRFTPAVTV